MPVDPILIPILEKVNTASLPAHDSMTTTQLRAFLEQRNQQNHIFSESPPSVESTTVYTVPVADDNISIRLYFPQGTPPFPAHIYMHTGGFWLNSFDECDTWCRELCHGARCIVISVNYRLAPEHKFPVALEDCYTTLCWIHAHHEELHIDPTRLSIGGASAGANLATVTAMMAKDRHGPSLVFQMLELPTTDLTMSQPSISHFGEGYLLTRGALEHIRSLYLSSPHQANEPYASPLLATNLTRLPPALIMTTEFDPLRDEGEAYGQRLQEARVPTEIIRWNGLFHTSEHFTAILPAARQFRTKAIDSLLRAYHTH